MSGFQAGAYMNMCVCVCAAHHLKNPGCAGCVPPAPVNAARIRAGLFEAQCLRIGSEVTQLLRAVCLLIILTVSYSIEYQTDVNLCS